MAIKITKEEFEKKFGQGVAPTPPQSGVNLGITDAFKGGIAQTGEGYNQAKNATNPLQFLEGGTKLAAGAFNTAFSPLAPIMKPVGAATNYIGNKIGNVPAVQQFANSSTGRATQRITEDVNNLNTVVGGVAGTMATGGGIKSAAETVGETAKPAIAGTGRILKSAGEGSYGVTVNPSEGTMRAMQTYKESSPNLASRIKNTVSGETKGKPITEANTAARYGLMGTEKEIGVQAGRYMQDVWKNKVEPALNQTKGKLDMKKFFDVVENEIRSSTPELTRRNDLIEGLDALRSQYNKVGKVSLRKLQDYKEGWAKTLPESSFKGKPIASSLKEVKSIARSKAAQFIYDNTPEGTRQDYIDYGNLKSIREAGIKSGVGDLAKKSLSRGAWQFIMDKAVTPVATVLGKILYRTGEGLEFLGEDGAKTVGDIVGKETPNKQGGFVNFGEIAKSVDNTDKNIMLSFIDAVNSGKTPSKEIMARAQKIADAMGLESNMASNSKLAKDFNTILDLERESVKSKLK